MKSSIAGTTPLRLPQGCFGFHQDRIVPVQSFKVPLLTQTGIPDLETEATPAYSSYNVIKHPQGGIPSRRVQTQSISFW